MLPMAAALAERGHELSILIPPYDNPADSGQVREQDGVRIENMRARDGGPVALWSVSGQLAARVKTLNPDVVHVFKPVGPAALAAARGGWRAGLLVDNDDWEGRGGWLDVHRVPALMKAFLAWQEPRTLWRAHAVTCASDVLIARSRQLAPGVAVALFPNGPLGSLRSEVAGAEAIRESLRAGYGWTGKRVIIYLGTIPRANDMDVALAAFVACAADDPLVTWCVIATGQGLPGLRDAAAATGFGERIEWHGFMPHDDAVKRLVAADIAVYPYRDTLINRAKCSGKVIDYMAAGKPMVVSDVGMNRAYMDDGVHGLLTPPGNAAAFTAALQSLLIDPAYAKTMGIAAQSRLWERFDWRARAPQLEALYAQVLSERG